MLKTLLAVVLAGSAASAAATDLVPSPLAGATWQVIAIDGRAVEPPHRDDDGVPRPPAFSFGHRGYGGNAGCNALGGLYAQVGERLYTMPGPQTAMGCRGARGAQEDAANAILSASPTVKRSGDKAELAGGGHTMTLRRLGAANDVDPPAPWQGSGLSGQTYVIQSVNGLSTDGKRIWSKAPPRLRFAPGKVTMRLDCPTQAVGPYTQSSEYLYAALFPPVCRTPGTRDAAMARILGADPRVVSGPNGELLLASRYGWAILWNERRDRPK
jgi:heat shock protein HslJ